MRFVLDQQKVESTTNLQFIRQICSIFFHNTIETCNEFKQAFEVDKYVNKAIEECDYLNIKHKDANQMLLFDFVRPLYHSEHPRMDTRQSTLNGNDISSQILSHHGLKSPEDPLMQARCTNNYRTFYYLSTYASLTRWITVEFEEFASLFRKHVFNNPQLSTSMIAESIYHLRNQCSKMAIYCEIDMSHCIERKFKNEIRENIAHIGRNLVETIKMLDGEEKWQPQQFQNKAQRTRFFEEMKDVDLNTMSNYIFDDFKLHFTASKTSFARCFLVTVNDLAKVSRVKLVLKC